MEWALLPFKRYAEFSGRSRRKEYWLFALLLIAITIVLSVLVATLFGMSISHTAVAPDGMPVVAPAGMAGLGMGMLLFALLALAVIIPSIAVQVRRFHDQDKSGWFVLLNLIPYVGGIVVLVFMCLDGTPGPNRYGPDPKAGERLLP